MEKSKVSAFLAESIDPRLQLRLFGPQVERETAPGFASLSLVNKAHVLMLSEQGILDSKVSAELARAILDLDAAGPGALPRDAAREDAFFNYEARLIEVSGPEIGGRMHTGRSRNDLKSTQDRLRARGFALDLLDGLNGLRATLIAGSAAHAGVVMPGYTHLQPAQPVTFGWYLLGLLKAFERDHDRIAGCYQRINLNPLGAGALAGTSYPISRTRTQELLGFDALVEHTLDAVASRDYLVELLGAVTLLATTWSRVAQDFYVMTSYEFQTLELPDRVAGTSSMMPQKKNMVVLEDLKASAAQVLGAYATAVAAIRSAHFTNTVDGNREAFRWCWEALGDARDALDALDVVLEAARPRPARMRALVEANYSTATDLADALVLDAGLAFREAHHVAGAVIRAAHARGLVANQIGPDLLAEVSKREFGRRMEVSAETLADVLDPVRGAERRRGTGGPAQADIQAMLASSRHRLDADRKEQKARRNRVTEAETRLVAAFATLAAGEVSR